MVQKAPIEGQNGNNSSNIHPLQVTGSYFKNMLLEVLSQSTSFEQNHLNGILQDGFRDLERWLNHENHSDFETDCINNLKIALDDGVALLHSPKINIDDVYKIESRIEQYCHSLNVRIEVIPKNFFIDNPLKFDWTTPEPTRSIRIIGTNQAGNSFNITSNISGEEVNNIDTEGPKGTLSYSTTALTNGDVTVTINLNKDVFNTPAGWTKINATTFTKVYIANASETVNFVDVAGNAGSVNVLVTNIDKVGPDSLTFVGTTPSEQGTSYTGLVLSVGKRIRSIASITSSTGGAIGNMGINGGGNIQFDWTTPNAAGSVIRIIGTDEAGNSFNVTVGVSGLES